MQSSLILLGDLGAGTNLVKNIFLLDPRYTSPFDYSRVATLYNGTLDNWLELERTTRINLIADTVEVDSLQPNLYVNHSAFHNTLDFEKLQKLGHCVALLPKTRFAFDWQVRAYIEKAGNILDFGGATVEENIINMHEIMFARKSKMEQSGIDIVYTDSLYQGDFDSFYNSTSRLVDIDYVSAKNIYTQWHDCHWKYEDTHSWEYYKNGLITT